MLIRTLFITQAKLAIMSAALVVSANNFAQTDPSQLPAASKDQIIQEYRGSFKIQYSDNVSRSQFIEGRIAYNPANHSIFLDSNHQHEAVAEFAIPQNLSFSSNHAELPEAAALQGYRQIFTATDTGNSQALDKIGGMALINGQLVIQAYETYDAKGDNTHTTAVVRNPSNLASSNIDGFFEMDGAARTVMYLSEIPPEWRSKLGGSWLAGMGAGMSINSRFSEGPSMYVFNPADLSGTSGRVNTNKYLDYPYDKALSTSLYQGNGPGGWDDYNSTGKNLLWTQISSARFGFIVPNTRTFMVIGTSGALEYSGGYKIVNDEGYQCGGPCPADNEDVHTYYWLYDLNDILSASNSYDPIPYEYGIFDDRFLSYDHKGAIGTIRGGSFDPESGMLYLVRATVGGRDRYPVVSLYKLNYQMISPPKPPSGLNIKVTN